MKMNLYPGKKSLYGAIIIASAVLIYFAAGYMKAAYSHLLGNLSVWQMLFIVIGILAISTAILNLFTSLGDHTRYRWSAEIENLDTGAFLTGLSHLCESPLGLGGRPQILNNGDAFLKSFVEDINKARKSINITIYIWENGQMSDQILGALVNKLKEGVEVRILIDGFGGLYAPRKKFERLRQKGARVERFRTAQFGKLTRLHRRTHRRAIIIDGQIGYIGGMAIGDKWLGNARNRHEWRDMMFRVNNSMAQSLQGAFAQLWAASSGEILMGEKFYPALPRDTSHTVPYLSLASAPASDTQSLPKVLWLSIACAKQKLYIVSPYFVPDKHLRKILVDRARAGVDVRLMLPNHFTDARPIRAASHFYYEELLKAGVTIYEFAAARLHTKLLVADGVWSIIGSPNLDRRSVELNEENILGVQDQNFALELEKVFLDDIKKSDAILLTAWKQRGLLARAWETLCVHFVKQY